MKKMMFISVFFLALTLISVNASAGRATGRITSIRINPFNHFTIVVEGKILRMCKGAQNLLMPVEDSSKSAYYQLAMKAYDEDKTVIVVYKATQGNLGCVLSMYLTKQN